MDADRDANRSPDADADADRASITHYGGHTIAYYDTDLNARRANWYAGCGHRLHAHGVAGGQPGRGGERAAAG